MISSLANALGQAARDAVAPVAWNCAGAVAALAVILVAALGALGFAAAGFYMAMVDALRLSPVASAFITAGGLLAVALIAALCLRRTLFGRRAEPRPTVSDEARRTISALEAETAEAIAARPAASLLACGIAGLLVGTLRRPPRA